MPPAKGRRRKAQPKLAAVQEDDQAPDQAAQPVEHEEAAQGTVQEAGALQAKLEEVDARVASMTEGLWQAALEDTEKMRQQLKVLCLNIPKKTLHMTLDAFFSLTDEEAQACVLSNVNTRMQAVLSESMQADAAAMPPPPPRTARQRAQAAESQPAAEEPQTAEDAAGTSSDQQPPDTAARATRRTRATRGGQAAHAPPLPPTANKRATRGARAAAAATTDSAVPQGDDATTLDHDQMDTTEEPSAAAAGAADEAAASRTAADAQETGARKRVTRSRAKGTAGALADMTNVVPSTPLHAGLTRGPGKAAALVEATPAGVGFGAPLLGAPGTALRGGFTVVRKAAGAATAARPGRSKGATTTETEDDNAIVFTTADGEQVIVDPDVGLAGVPEQHRAEVQQQMQLLQRLAARTLQLG